MFDKLYRKILEMFIRELLAKPQAPPTKHHLFIERKVYVNHLHVFLIENMI